ncbi:MAG TPA: hypothetical protein VGY98_16275, partial [Verrucomicrobiae bacterium]|nr:hypothetical protein [Verrucomicrobiae bacterium]
MNLILRIACALLLFSALIHAPGNASGQNTAITYQGLVTDNGTNFDGAGQFQFALETSTNGQPATATATMGGAAPNEFVSSIAVNIGGSGYTAAPVVTITGGGGAGATARANISGGKVTSITVLAPGGGYSGTATVTIAPPSPVYTTAWSNDGSSVNGSEPSSAVSVTVSQGLFTVILGNTALANMTGIPATVFATATNLQLMIWFNDGVNGFAPLNPPQNVTATPYAASAYFANTASNLTGAISTAQLNGIVPLSQLPPALVTNNEATVTLGSLDLTGVVNGNGAGLTNLNAVQLTSIGNTSGGGDNFFVGPSGSATTSGFWNTAEGVLAITNDTSGNWNTAIGGGAARLNASGSLNTAVGSSALLDNRAGHNNTAAGANTLDNLGLTSLAGGTNNIALGFNAGSAFTANESGNIDIGNTGVAAENDVIRIGTPGVQASTWIAGVINGNGGGLTNIQLTAGGSPIFYFSNSAANLFVGSSAGNPAADAGIQNIAVGSLALSVNSSGDYNTANGYAALQDNTSGSGNTANGNGALYFNTNGSDNTAVGHYALVENTSGSHNTAVGVNALYFNGTNSQNTAVGAYALDSFPGSNNIAVGYQAGHDYSGQESGNIDIGNVGQSGENNTIRIGSGQSAAYIAGFVNDMAGARVGSNGT